MSRSQSATILNENQELIERNRNLELKLRYVQSVNTMFRQRVGVLLQALTTKLAEIQLNNNMINASASSPSVPPFDINLSSLLNTVNDSASLIQYQQQHVDAASIRNSFSPQSMRSESGGAGNTNNSSSGSFFAQSEVAYWQDRFIDAMSNIQPISQSEVETLCRLIREKVDRDALIHQQDKQIRTLQQQQEQQEQQKRSSANGSNNNNNSIKTYADDVADEVAALRQQLAASDARCKSLNHRLAEMRRKEHEAEAQKAAQNLDLTHEVGSLAGTVRELRARLAEQEALNRRLTTEVSSLCSDKNLQLQHLSRMQGMCAAVMRESQCAVNEGLAATQMNETALLKRQLDTFELVLRTTEQELAHSKKLLDEKDSQLTEKEREVQALQLRLESKEKTMDLYRQRCERMATQEKEQREEHLRAMNLLKSRLGDAVGELEGAYTTKDIGHGLQKMTTSADRIAALSTQLTDMQRKYATLRSCFAALSEELTLSSKQGRPPNLESVTAEEARVLITRDDSAKSAGSADDSSNVIIKVPREKVLRSEGTWREVRDLNEGSVFYVTTKIDGTPFDPISAEQRAQDKDNNGKQQRHLPPQQSSKASPSPSPIAPSSPKDTPATAVPTTDELVLPADDSEGQNNANNNEVSPEQPQLEQQEQEPAEGDNTANQQENAPGEEATTLPEE